MRWVVGCTLFPAAVVRSLFPLGGFRNSFLLPVGCEQLLGLEGPSFALDSVVLTLTPEELLIGS